MASITRRQAFVSEVIKARVLASPGGGINEGQAFRVPVDLNFFQWPRSGFPGGAEPMNPLQATVRRLYQATRLRRNRVWPYEVRSYHHPPLTWIVDR